MNKLYMFTLHDYPRLAIVCAESEENARYILLRDRDADWDSDNWCHSDCEEVTLDQPKVLAVSNEIDQCPDSGPDF